MKVFIFWLTKLFVWQSFQPNWKIWNIILCAVALWWWFMNKVHGVAFRSRNLCWTHKSKKFLNPDLFPFFLSSNRILPTFQRKILERPNCSQKAIVVTRIVIFLRFVKCVHFYNGAVAMVLNNKSWKLKTFSFVL